MDAQRIFQRKYLHPDYFCDEGIGNKKTGQYDKKPGTLIVNNCCDHLRKLEKKK
jgi:hypothetical protein